MEKQPSISPAFIAYGLLIIATLSWGGNAIAGKMAAGVISPFAVVTLRWAIVAPLATIIAYQALRRDWPQIKARLGFAILIGSLGFTFFNSFFYIAAHHTQAINIGIVQGVIPIFVLLLSLVIFREKIKKLQISGILVTIIGVFIIVSKGNIENLVALKISIGDLYMVCACLGYALYAIGLQKRPKVDMMAFFAVLSWIALITSLPMLIVEWQSQDLIMPSGHSWWIILYIALFPSFLAQIFFLKGVDLIGANRSGIFVNLVPVFASFLAVIILNEAFYIYHGLALMLVLGGITLSEKGKL